MHINKLLKIMRSHNNGEIPEWHERLLNAIVEDLHQRRKHQKLDGEQIFINKLKQQYERKKS